MNTTKCQILLKAVELGSITRAAEALGYTQSAVSRAVADLEREWDVALLTRNRSGTVLTSQGEALLPYLQALCNAGRELETQVAALHGLTRGTLRVGTFASASIQLLPAIMKEFMGLYPGIRFELLCCWEFAQVEDLIRRGQADCGFLGLPVGPDLETFPLFRDQLMAILPPDHPLSQAPFYPMARFAEDPFIRVPEDRDVEFGRIFQQAGVRPNLHYTVNDDFAIQAMVEQGLGVSIQPELILQNSGHRFAAIPLEQPHFRDLVLAVRRGRAPSVLTARFVDCVRRWIGQAHPSGA